MGPIINRKKGTLIALLLFSCFILNEIACTRLIKRAPLPSELKTPAEEKALLTTILSKASDRLKYLKNMKAFAETTIQLPQKKVKRKNIILFRNDPSIRFEGLSISGKPFMYFISNNKNSSIYYPDRNVLFEGAYSPSNIARIIGFNIELKKIISILSGNFDIPTETQKVALKESKDYYLMTFSLKNNITKEVFLDKESYLPLELIEYDLTKNDIIKVQYRNYKKINNYFLPLIIKIEKPKKNLEILIRYISVFLNQGIPDSSFTLPIIKGVKILPLSNH